MSWSLLIALVIALSLALGAAIARRRELAQMRTHVRARDRAQRAGARAELEHPVVDLSRCLGCGACVRACPEDGVLALVHGQAMVVNGSRCRGHARCAEDCPVDAITVTLAGAATREDLPALTDELEAIGAPGVFLAGEITARALIKTAIEQGTSVANAVARRAATFEPSHDVLDVAIVGAGPAGLACALESQRLGCSYVVLDRECAIGGTVARYPRKKLVVTRPVELPLHGVLDRHAYEKEELIDLWGGIARRHQLRIACGETFEELAREPDGTFTLRSCGRVTRARSVVFAIGRRGAPRRLGVAGEELPHVANALLDARAHAGRRVLVVGGGESAVEAAIALSEQEGASVVLAHRGEAFVRISASTERRLAESLEGGRLQLALGTVVRAIHRDHVDLVPAQPHDALELGARAPGSLDTQATTLATGSSRAEPRGPVAAREGGVQPMRLDASFASARPSAVAASFAQRPHSSLAATSGAHDGRAPWSEARSHAAVASGASDAAAWRGFAPRAREGGTLRVDDVFVLIGGEAPRSLLERCGVSFDPALRPRVAEVVEQGTGLVRALATGLALALATLVIALYFADYYLLPRAARPEHELHLFLRPGRGAGLALGIASTALVAVNLAYLLRRSRKLGVTFGSLSAWMTSHVATGILALLLALLHGGLDARDTVGGHALLALAFLLVTGAIGRYFYASVPRAANGRELELAEVRSELSQAAARVDHRAREAFDAAAGRMRELVERRQWRATFLGRVAALVGGERELRLELARLRDEARDAGLDERAAAQVASLARRAHRAAVGAAHLEDLRALLSTWRWFHRWVAALFVLLVAMHVVFALSHGSVGFGGGVP